MRSYSIKRAETLLFFLLLLVADLSAQESGVSPYSRFGLGDPNSGVFSSGFAMGGLSIGVMDRTQINPLNPATLPYLSSPGFDVGMRLAQETASTSDISVTNGYGRLNHFALGLPMAQGKWGAGFGLSPYTVVGYEGAETTYIPELDISQTSEYSGSGGLNKINLSIARRLQLTKDTSQFGNNSYLSLSGTLNYYLGSISLKRSSIFPINNGFHNTRLDNATTINSISPSGSLLYRMMLNKIENKEDHSFSVLNVGAMADFGGSLAARRSQEVYSFVGNAGDLEFERDSILSFSDRKGTVTLPSTFGVGASMEFYFKKKESSERRRLMIGLDYKTSAWSSLQNEFEVIDNYENVGDSDDLIFGLSYTPAVSGVNKQRVPFFASATYRMGMRSSNTHILIDSESLTESGISFGASFPILTAGVKESDTQVTFGVDYGKRGTTDNGLIEEQFTRVMIGFSFHPSVGWDRWFEKRKYD